MNIVFKLTAAGRAALLDDPNVDVIFSHFVLGDGASTLDETATALTNERERKPFYDSSDAIPGQLMLAALFDTDPPSAYMATEAGVIADGVLFAVWTASNPPTDALVYRMAGVPYRPKYYFALDGLPSANITVQTQPLDIVAQQLIDNKLAQHKADANAHSWAQISGKPASFPPSSHNHDGRYFTEAESNGRFLRKSSDTASEIYNNGWYRSNGQKGWYSQSYGGGVYMVDSTYVRVYGGKAFYCTNDVIAYSDERDKRDWRALPDDLISQLASLDKSGLYTRISTGQPHIGVGAQSLEKILPAAVHSEADGKKAIAYGNAALAVCVELAKELVRLRSQIQSGKGDQ